MPPATLPLHPPSYAHGSLPDVIPAVVRALGVELGAGPPGTPARGRAEGRGFHTDLGLVRARGAVVVLLDGLGDRLLRARAGHAPFLRSLLPTGLTLTSGYPSTTATSLASLGTGLPPGEHGLVGYATRVPGTRTVFDHLSWEGGPDPLAWQPTPTAFEAAVTAGLPVVRIGLPRFDGSGLTTAALRGGRFIGATSLRRAVDAAVGALRREPRSLVYLYWGDIDRMGHAFGCNSREWLNQLEDADAELRRLAERLPGEATLVVTADHGMVDVPLTDRIDLAVDPQLAAGVVDFGGEARSPQLYCAPGSADDVAATWRGRFGAHALIATREEAIDTGWFGPVASRNAPRIGDVVVALGVGLAVEDSRVFKPVLRTLIGLHGSLTPSEIEVPLLQLPPRIPA